MTLLSEIDATHPDAGKPVRSGIVERVTLVMDVFGPDRRSARLEDVVEHTGLPRSTAFRILRQLVDKAWLEYGPEGFRLGRRLHELHGCAVDYTDIRAAASPVLADLSLKTGAVSHLGCSRELRALPGQDRWRGDAQRPVAGRGAAGPRRR